MARKEGFIVGDIFAGQEPSLWLKLEHPVDQQERVSVRQQAQHLVNIHRFQLDLPNASFRWRVTAHVLAPLSHLRPQLGA
jgi:hypothetical protein